MATVRLPGILAREAGGQNRFETRAATLGEALHELPIADLIFDAGGALRPLVNIFVDGQDARDQLEALLAGEADVRVVAAVAGGCEPACARSTRARDAAARSGARSG